MGRTIWLKFLSPLPSALREEFKVYTVVELLSVEVNVMPIVSCCALGSCEFIRAIASISSIAPRYQSDLPPETRSSQYRDAKWPLLRVVALVMPFVLLVLPRVPCPALSQARVTSVALYATISMYVTGEPELRSVK